MQKKKSLCEVLVNWTLGTLCYFCIFPSFVLLLYLWHGYKLHRLNQRIKSILFSDSSNLKERMFVICVFFLFTCYFRGWHTEISNYGIEIPLCQHLQGIIQKKKKKPACWVVCSMLVWTSVSAVHTSFFTESSCWNKGSVFGECTLFDICWSMVFQSL